MAKRRKRRSTASTERMVKEIRSLHREHLKEISAILTNALGFKVRVIAERPAEVLQIPRAVRGKKGKVTRKVAHVAGYGRDDAPPEVEAVADLPNDDIQF